MNKTNCLLPGVCFRTCCSPEGSHWARLPAREHSAAEVAALKELVALAAVEGAEERAALAAWLNG